jgi:ABC-type transporter Mla MlaB component
MSQKGHTPPRLGVRHKDPSVLIVEMAGDWRDRTGLPDLSALERELVGDGLKALQFEVKDLGRWDSALMVRILAIHDLCAKAKVEFRTQTLPPGLAKLIALSLTVPEKSDVARKEVTPSFLERVGGSLCCHGAV